MTKYVALSDTHLGQNGGEEGHQYSLLSQVPARFPDHKRRADKTLNQLAHRIETFSEGEDVTLVACGDLLDLSLAYFGDALTDLGAMLTKLSHVERLVWVVGNHDHHVWSLHSEETRVLSHLREGRAPLPKSAYHATSPDSENLKLLQPLLRSATGRDITVDIAYPTFRLPLVDHGDGVADEDRDVLCYFTHGHLLGGLYTIASRILEGRLPNTDPEAVAATVNLSVIEFIYWLLGESGDGIGADGFIEDLYTDLQKGDASLARELIDQSVDRLLADGIITGIPDGWERAAIKRLAHALLKKAAKGARPDRASDRHRSIEDTQKAFAKWLVDRAQLPGDRRVIAAMGHTHVKDRHVLPGTKTETFNLGSWLVEPNHGSPDMQLLFINEANNGLTVEFERFET